MNLYDFNDLSDLPTDLSKRLSTSAVANPNVGVYADIIAKASEAGLKIMSISQIEAVAHRMGLDSKAQQTIRTALNSGVKAGLLVKPSRQTYALAPTAEEVGNGLDNAPDAAPDDVLDAVVAAGEPVASAADAQIDPLA